jgi:5-methylcytosine-specific restriction endonuclease McrA
LGSPTRTAGRLGPLSPTRVRVEFSARAELYEKLDRARQLLSHAVPSGDLGELFERALDALLEQETRKRFGVQKPRKPRKLKPGSRRVPGRIERAVWERDGSQCTHIDAKGRRCGERRFLTIEHRIPFALGGPPTLDNLCLLCRAHNLENARQVFGEQHIEAKIGTGRREAVSNAESGIAPRPLDVVTKVRAALCQLGFRPTEASAAVGKALGSGPALDVEQLLRACLVLLLPVAS